jgi:hypothetical protein
MRLPTREQVQKSALGFLILGAGIVVGVLVMAGILGVGAHDRGFIVFVLPGELLGLMLLGFAALFFVLSFFFPRQPP